MLYKGDNMTINQVKLAAENQGLQVKYITASETLEIRGDASKLIALAVFIGQGYEVREVNGEPYLLVFEHCL